MTQIEPTRQNIQELVERLADKSLTKGCKVQHEIFIGDVLQKIGKILNAEAQRDCELGLENAETAVEFLKKYDQIIWQIVDLWLLADKRYDRALQQILNETEFENHCPRCGNLWEMKCGDHVVKLPKSKPHRQFWSFILNLGL